MDLLVHSAAGTFIGWVLPQRWTGPGATRIIVAAALLPDADNLIPFLDPGSGFAHRGFTHSLCGVAVLAPLAALVAWRFSREKRLARLVTWITVAMLSHIVLEGREGVSPHKPSFFRATGSQSASASRSLVNVPNRCFSFRRRPPGSLWSF